MTRRSLHPHLSAKFYRYGTLGVPLVVLGLLSIIFLTVTLLIYGFKTSNFDCVPFPRLPSNLVPSIPSSNVTPDRGKNQNGAARQQGAQNTHFRRRGVTQRDVNLAAMSNLKQLGTPTAERMMVSIQSRGYTAATLGFHLRRSPTTLNCLMRFDIPPSPETCFH